MIHNCVHVYTVLLIFLKKFLFLKNYATLCANFGHCVLYYIHIYFEYICDADLSLILIRVYKQCILVCCLDLLNLLTNFVAMKCKCHVWSF